jgi:Na+-translocating ferredoxin:NAD+ oxidoreductase RnfG subunit
MSRSLWYQLAVAPAVVMVASPAAATDYLTIAQAQRALVPQARDFRPFPVSLSDQQRKQIRKLSGTPQRNSEPKVWQAVDGGKPLGWVYVDEVIGKHEYITYAAAISPDGHVLGVEIISYRESKGGQVRNERWREQFNGKSLPDRLRLGKDIANISGATLSCRNITDGVKRLLALQSVLQSDAG